MGQEAVAIVALASVLVYLIASMGLVPFVASEKRRSALGWIAVSLLVSPLLALIALAALPPSADGDPTSPFEAELRSR